jgi:hypothetical protein
MSKGIALPDSKKLMQAEKYLLERKTGSMHAKS